MLSLRDEKHPVLSQTALSKLSLSLPPVEGEKSLTGFWRGHFQAFSRK